MKQNLGTKGFIGLVSGVMGYLCNCLTELVVVLAILMIVDYITGITSALKNGQFDKEKGVWGAVKKIFYVFLLLLGFLLDYVIKYMTASVGITLPFQALFGIAVTLYLIGTEGFSTTQNLIVIGLPVPDYVVKAFGLIKDESGKIIQAQKEVQLTPAEKQVVKNQWDTIVSEKATLDGQADTFGIDRVNYDSQYAALLNYITPLLTDIVVASTIDDSAFRSKFKDYYDARTALSKALADAAKAQDTADGKRRTFITTPVAPYNAGDLWISGGGIMRCNVTKIQGQTYSASDWGKASQPEGNDLNTERGDIL